MNPNHPLRLEIQKGESKTLEFKQQLPISFDSIANYHYPLEKVDVSVVEAAFKTVNKTLMNLPHS